MSNRTTLLHNGVRSSRKTLILLALAVTTLAFFTSHASMSLDPPNHLKVTQSIVDHGDLQVRLTPEELDNPGYMPAATTMGLDGNRYLGYHGIGQSLIFIGPYILFRHVLGIESDKLLRSAISVTLFPINLALIAVVMFLLLREFNITPRRSFLAAVLVVFATGLWETSRECQDATHIAFLFALTAYGLRKYQNTAHLKFLALAALSIGYAFITRSDTAPTVLCFLLFASWLIIQHNRQAPTPKTTFQKFWPFILLVGLTAPALAIEIYHNIFRFGHPISSYQREYSWALLIRGLKGLLFSPGKSLFIYNPIVLLAIPGFFVLWRRYRAWTLYILVGFTGCLLIHSAIYEFHGNICWGPRYLLRYLPLFFIPIAIFFFDPPRSSVLRKSVFFTITLASIIVQIASVSLHYNREIGELDHAYEGTWTTKEWTMFEPEAFFLKHRFRNIVTSVDDMIHDRIAPWPTKPTYKLTEQQQLNVPAMNYLAFWPFHLTYYLPAVKPQWALPLWASTLIFVGGLFVGWALLGWAWLSCPRLSPKHIRVCPPTRETFENAWPSTELPTAGKKSTKPQQAMDKVF